MDQEIKNEQAAAPTFQLGLALAGAISAGAYTAGVIDFLIQALQEWDDHRDQPDTPQHRVAIKVITGASAGAITGALGAIALARGLKPRDFTSQEKSGVYPDRFPEHQRFQCVMPGLYKTWVTLPAMISADGVGGLLATDDLKPDALNPAKPVLRSLLNGKLLDGIKVSAIEPPDGSAGEVRPPVPYVAERLHLYLTISNMRGIPFRVAFGRNNYGMQTIGDRVHYVVGDLGSAKLSDPKSCPKSWVEQDAEKASLPISVATLPRRGDPLGDWDRYGNSALASAAFPLGLAPRQLNFTWDHYWKRKYPIPIPEGFIVEPDFPRSMTQTQEFVFQSVDGGLVNNNPFDYAQYALHNGPASGPTSGHDVDRAIIMVAPFPEPPEPQPEGSPSPAVMSILKNLFSSLINQARFRTADLAPAFDEQDFSRYLIAPLRRIPRQGPPGEIADDLQRERFSIACGLLGGFGGFLDEKFRAHDFQLGRRNCQQFLRSSLLVRPDNVVVGRPGGGGRPMLPVIPLLGETAKPVPLPLWPQMTEADYDKLCARVDLRIDAVAPYLIDSETSNVKLRLALKFGWSTFLRSRAIDFVHQAILVDLVRRGQIKGWEIPSELVATAAQDGHTAEDVQAILAELLDPGFDFRTARSVAKTTHLPEEFVAKMLTAMSPESVPPRFRTWQNNEAFTLFSRRPNLISRLPGIKSIVNWWDAPNIS